ncbi:unnamed protein product [Phytophthora fragariaefolia]|uniref:Unnamed protein product n=1 Tax=Phytophthora fragariaefolia TaxID=1490495 RepID=A0A9W6Y1I3_9STRA|nr:unnamed protein product [Phytophthora fragariaefolia]
MWLPPPHTLVDLWPRARIRLHHGILAAYGSLLLLLIGFDLAVATPDIKENTTSSIASQTEYFNVIARRENEIAATRLLKTNIKVKNEEEEDGSDQERANVPGLEKISSLVKKGVSKSTDMVRL